MYSWKDSLESVYVLCITSVFAKKENEVIESVKEEIKDAIKEADQAPKQKVSDFLKSMFEEPNQTLAEQIAYYEAKETK